MWLSQWARHKGEILEIPVPPAVRRDRLSPGRLNDLQTFRETILTLLVQDTIGIVSAWEGAEADTKNQPAPLIWSIVAVSSARRNGWTNGRICTAVPILMRCVRTAIALATVSGADNNDRVGFM